MSAITSKEVYIDLSGWHLDLTGLDFFLDQNVFVKDLSSGIYTHHLTLNDANVRNGEAKLSASLHTDISSNGVVHALTIR